jgi:hypothetical protein
MRLTKDDKKLLARIIETNGRGRNGPICNGHSCSTCVIRILNPNTKCTPKDLVETAQAVLKEENKMATQLTITKEKVLEAAAKCSTAKDVLKTIFPEVFVDDKFVDTSNWAPMVNGFGSYVIRPCGTGDLAGKALWLSTDYNWRLSMDSDHHIVVIIPTRK